ncbi:hypothetical protein ACI3PL_24870, partial [Lacticaseibacillus paracasei]
METKSLNPMYDNWKEKPWLYWKACAVSLDGRLINPELRGAGRDVYFPLIGKRELWMNKDDVELFPETGAD